MHLYAELDENGNYKKMLPEQGEISAETKAANNIVDFVVDPDPEYNGDTHKKVGSRVVVVAGVARQQAIIEEKSKEDLIEDCLTRRRNALPLSEERIEFVAKLMLRLIDWAALQAKPGDPASVFNISPEETDALEGMIECCEMNHIPDEAKRLPHIAARGHK